MKHLRSTLAVTILLLATASGDAMPRRQSAIPSGLVGYWKLDEGSGVVAGDSSGGGHDGTLMGGTVWIAGRFGNAVGLDGSTGYIRVPRHGAFESPGISISLWMVALAPTGSWANLVRKAWQNDWAPSFTSWGLQLNPIGTDPTVVAFNTGYSGGVDVLSSPTGTIAPGRSTHLVAVYQQGRKEIYVNGSLVASNTSSASILYDTTATGDLYFGQSGAPGEFFYGGLDEIQIYDRALSASEAAFLSNPIAPGAPVGLTARVGDARIALAWSPPSGSFPTSYEILRSSSSGGSGTVIASGVTGTTYDDRGLTNMTTYYYTVQAANPAGKSGPSNEVSATPVASVGGSPHQRCGCGSAPEVTGFGLVGLAVAALIILAPPRIRPRR